MEQVSVAIKKHKHKSFEGPEMVKKKFPPVLWARPGNVADDALQIPITLTMLYKFPVQAQNQHYALEFKSLISSKNKQTGSEAKP